MYLVDPRGDVVWWHMFAAGSNWWDAELTEAVVRFGDLLLIGANAEVIAMPIGAGAPRWRLAP